MENSRGVVRCAGTVQENHSEMDGRWYEKTTAGWAMVQEHHDWAGRRWCEKTKWAVVREDCDWVGS